MSGLISKYSVLATAPPIIVRKSYDTFIQKNLKESQARQAQGGYVARSRVGDQGELKRPLSFSVRCYTSIF